MEPQIQYVTTEDGVSIAYYAIGQGPPQLLFTMAGSHLEAEWQIESFRAALMAAARRSTIIRFDPRGFGLSDRDPTDFALDGFVKDIEAVIDRLGIEGLRINAIGPASIPALAYAARHPDKVTHLAQMPPAASGDDLKNERLEKLVELAQIDWDLASEPFLRTLNPALSDDLVRDLASMVRASVQPETLSRLFRDVKEWDADAEAAALSTPTLLIHERNNPNFRIAVTRRVAGLIENSRVVFAENAFEGSALAWRFFEDDVPSRSAPESATEVPSPGVGSFRTILFTDVEGSTALTDRLGDDRARKLLRQHDRITREALKEHGGSEVKTMGDGFMTSFTSATAALNCAIALQRGFADHNQTAEEAINVRVGLDAGEPIEEDEDLFGAVVNEAARITSTAEGGEILVANVVRELTKGKDFLFADRGETSLRGFEDPVRLFEVRWSE